MFNQAIPSFFQERGILLFKAAADGDIKTVQKLNAANFQDKASRLTLNIDTDNLKLISFR